MNGPEQDKKAMLYASYSCCNGDCGHQQVAGVFLEHAGINMAETTRKETIDIVIDSGAAESVAPASIAPWIPAAPSEGSKKGQQYLNASGEKLPNLGEKKIRGLTNESFLVNSTFQLAEVTRPLCSVSQICDRGNEVHFDQHGGYIISESGRRTHFRRENNVYVLQLHADAGPMSSQGFPRQSMQRTGIIPRCS